MQTYPIIFFHHSQVISSARLLREFQGEILIICNKGKVEFCVQPRDPYPQLAVVRIVADTYSSNARFFLGVVTPKGGRFYVINRNEAVKRMDRWIVDLFE